MNGILLVGVLFLVGAGCMVLLALFVVVLIIEQTSQYLRKKLS